MSNVTDVSLLCWELNPEELRFYAIPYYEFSPEDLLEINGLMMNGHDFTLKQDEIWTRLNTYLEGKTKLVLPITLSNYSQLFHVGFVL